MTEELWGVTSYFNPCKYESRRRNFTTFRENIEVPLVAIELSFDGFFELAGEDAEIILQVTGGDVMWQKERLLNLALSEIPENCANVVLLDCDIVFEDSSWPERTCQQLRNHSMVQPFDRVYRLPQDIEPTDFSKWANHFRGYSTAAAEMSTTPMRGGKPWPYHGGAWAIKKNILKKHKLYDSCVVGGGDQAFVCAALGDYRRAMEPLCLTRSHAEHYLRWAVPFYDKVQGDISFVKGGLGSLWHGESSNRSYIERHKILSTFDFDPRADLCLSESGVWQWNSHKPEMHEFIEDYFRERMEDG